MFSLVFFFGLLFLMVVAVLKITIDIIKRYRCISEEKLYELYEGKIGIHSQEHIFISGHLGICSKCRKKLEQIQRGRSLEEHLID